MLLSTTGGTKVETALISTTLSYQMKNGHRQHTDTVMNRISLLGFKDMFSSNLSIMSKDAEHVSEPCL